jgi:hypothetical protein
MLVGLEGAQECCEKVLGKIGDVMGDVVSFDNLQSMEPGKLGSAYMVKLWRLTVIPTADDRKRAKPETLLLFINEAPFKAIT